jgi:hypothetical protein
MRVAHRRLPFKTGADPHAHCTGAFTTSKNKKVPSPAYTLNNIIKLVHRAARRSWRAGQYFRAFYTEERTLEAIESSNKRKGAGDVRREPFWDCCLKETRIKPVCALTKSWLQN